MSKNEDGSKPLRNEIVGSKKDSNTTKSKGKNRGKKRKRLNSGSSQGYEDVLPENAVDVDRSLYASAIKNNLDETSVRKIIKKVVTNDRVLALVKMREEEDSGPEEDSLRPKLTRAKVKELMKVSPKSKAWNLENLELTPIKHIPVKTRPEVKALIAQELPEDEDDEEYEPTNDDVPSDDDQGLESCSDLDSQPRTPATPQSLHSASPKVVKDGPFKVPQDVSTPTRRKLDLEEDATIALRTRSKLSLSATSIEHIESTFIPPDDIPMPAVDDLWNQFLNECLNPASTSKNEDDDETDPEYNVAADPDAHDEDEEALGNSIIKISKKELNDLVTELFNIMPEAAAEETLITDNLSNSVITDQSQTEVSTRWEGKQEQLSDEESGDRKKLCDRLTFEKKNYSAVSVGKTEPVDIEDRRRKEAQAPEKDAIKENNNKTVAEVKTCEVPAVVSVAVEEQVNLVVAKKVPPWLQQHVKPVRTELVHIQVNQASCVLPEQVQILQQQLRQHVQLATSSYLQLYVHPIHWSYAPTYREFLDTFMKMVEAKPNSVANVCNLKPAVELVTTWEKTVSANAPENTEMVKFIQNEADRCQRRGQNKNLYLGEFHGTFKKVVANSTVFLYPYLLPSMPYRGDMPRRFCYLHSEDELIALGLDQFWQYVAANPSIYKLRPATHPRHCYGLGFTVELVAKHMFPWMPVKILMAHIHNVRKNGDLENPIFKFFESRTVEPVKHKLLPYNPKLTLYEQPEHEVPRIWVRYLASTSSRFRKFLMRRTNRTGVPSGGIDVELGQAVVEPSKAPLPIDFTKQIRSHRPVEKPLLSDKFDIQITDKHTTTPVQNLYKFVETSTGAYLLPLTSVTMTVDSNTTPVTTSEESNTIANNLPEISKSTHILDENRNNSEHCTCCVLLRKICRHRQTVITDFFGTRKENVTNCACKEKRYPKVSNRLRLLVDNYKNNYKRAMQELQYKINLVRQAKDKTRLNEADIDNDRTELEDIAHVTNFHLKLLTKTSVAKNLSIKRKVHTVLSKFDPHDHDPLTLAAKLDQVFGHELVELYKEFLGFLTPEQVDKIDRFKDYFTRNCIPDLVRKVEEQVPDMERRYKILNELHKVFSKNLATACEICTGILSTLDGYPSLAQYVHSLFPHRKEERVQKDVTPVVEQDTLQPTQPASDVTAPGDQSTEMVTTIDYEADQSMSDAEDNGSKSSSDSDNNDDDASQHIKTENISMEYESPTSENVTLMVTVSKTELQDFSECSNTSLKIMFEDEMVKIECPEWKRDEDKLILEVLKEHLTPEERQDKTILEIIDEKNIVGMVSESLADKSKNDIKTRILYLLQIC